MFPHADENFIVRQLYTLLFSEASFYTYYTCSSMLRLWNLSKSTRREKRNKTDLALDFYSRMCALYYTLSTHYASSKNTFHGESPWTWHSTLLSLSVFLYYRGKRKTWSGNVAAQGHHAQLDQSGRRNNAENTCWGRRDTAVLHSKWIAVNVIWTFFYGCKQANFKLEECESQVLI